MIYLPPNPAIWFLLFLAGAAIGSFLNVVIYRWPRQESLVNPPSHCTSCGARLGFWDLIPVFSYILRRGRCAYCDHPFSPRYAIVELATGLLAVGAAAMFGLSWYALAVFVVCCCLVLVFFIDLDHMIIPDELIAIIAVIGVAVNLYNLWQFGIGGIRPGTAAEHYPITNALVFTEDIAGMTRTIFLPASVVGFLIGGGVFLFVSWFFQGVFGRAVMGFGDVKLAAAMGAMFGPGYLFGAWCFIAALVGGAVAIVIIVGRQIRRGDRVPAGFILWSVSAVLILVALGPLWSGGWPGHAWSSIWVIGSVLAGVVAAACGFWAGAREMSMRWTVAGSVVILVVLLVATFATGDLLALWCFISAVCGALLFIVLLLFGTGQTGIQIPFGPMLAVAGVVILVFPEVAAHLISKVPI